MNAVNTNILLWLEPASLLRAATAPSFEKETIAADSFVPDSETAKCVVKGETNKENKGPVQLPESLETLVVADALGKFFFFFFFFAICSVCLVFFYFMQSLFWYFFAIGHDYDEFNFCCIFLPL